MALRCAAARLSPPYAFAVAMLILAWWYGPTAAFACQIASAQQQDSTSVHRAAPESPAPAAADDDAGWLDRSRQTVYDTLWRSAMQVDRWFGSTYGETEYRKAFGSFAPAVLWDRYHGLATPVRFSVYWPLPALDERLHAFVGRFDPNEYISESDPPSGSFRRQYGPATEDQTLFGLVFRQAPRQGGYFDAGAGMRVTLPLDPYLKGSYVYVRGASVNGLFSLRETGFWERSQGFGVTTRVDIERIYGQRWLARWTGSGTLSQQSLGVTGWSAVDLMHGFPSRRAIALEFEVDGQTRASVPLHDLGVKFAYRQSVVRRWLVMELRSSVSWPKNVPQQPRRLSPGVGLGFEVLFGTDAFLARPVTF